MITYTHMGDDTMDDMVERCAYCDNVADDYCERCGTVVCDMHTIYDACPACAIVAHIKRFDGAMHYMMYGVVECPLTQSPNSR